MNEQTWVNPKIDRSPWPAGEWDKEPFDKVQWTDDATGLVCLARRNERNGNWCGYVGVAPGHPWHGKDYNDVRNVGTDDEYIDVHGGLTYADACDEGSAPLGICHIPEPGTPEHLFWFGFDCAHAWDRSPQDEVMARSGYPFTRNADEFYRDIAYVKNECRKLAAQLASASDGSEKS